MLLPFRRLLADPKLKEKLEKCGVYKIYHRNSGKTYIGSTARSFRERLTEHIDHLEKGSHHSRYLQNSFKYNPQGFLFSILEDYEIGTISVERLIWREQCFIDSLQPAYNSNKNADYRKKPAVKKWQLVSPEGETFLVSNLEKFCKEYKQKTKETLSPNYLSLLARGKKAEYKGWQAKRIET